MKICASEDVTGFAPSDSKWVAVDDDSYDGAEDSRCPIGRGATEAEAVADLMQQMPVTCPRCDAPREHDERPEGCRDVMCPREIWP